MNTKKEVLLSSLTSVEWGLLDYDEKDGLVTFQGTSEEGAWTGTVRYDQGGAERAVLDRWLSDFGDHDSDLIVLV